MKNMQNGINCGGKNNFQEHHAPEKHDCVKQCKGKIDVNYKDKV